MDFWRTVTVLLRRWYITVPAFLASLGLAGAAYAVTPVQYQSGAILVLTTPLSGGTLETHAKSPNSVTNPFLNFDGSLSLSTSIVIQQLNSPEVARTLGISTVGSTAYQVSNGSSNPELLESGPLLFVTGEAPSARAAQHVASRVSAMASVILARRQTELDVPSSARITIHTVVPPTAGQPLRGSPARAAAAVAALSGIASLVAVFGFESLMVHRRRRRADEEGGGRGIPAAEGASHEGVGIRAYAERARRPGERGVAHPPHFARSVSTAEES